jgi:hypothetical protein
LVFWIYGIDVLLGYKEIIIILLTYKETMGASCISEKKAPVFRKREEETYSTYESEPKTNTLDH